MANTDLGQTGILIRDNQVRAVKLVTHECDGAPVDPVEEHRTEMRYQNLGDHVTDEQYAAIESGTFDDLYVGDYWEIDGVKHRIADIDYYYDKDETGAGSTHHLVIVPDSQQVPDGMALHDSSEDPLMVEGMHFCDTDMCKSKLADIAAALESVFGSEHILSMTKRIGDRSYQSKAWFMCLTNIQGGPYIVPRQQEFGITTTYETPDDEDRFSLFKPNVDFVPPADGQAYWLEDSFSGGGDPRFAYVYYYGFLDALRADYSRTAGVRAAYLLIA